MVVGLSNTANYSDLPHSVIEQILLSNQCRIIYDRKSYDHYEDERNTISKLESIIYSMNNTQAHVDLKSIANLSKQLQLSEIMINKLPNILKHLEAELHPNYMDILHALDIQSITISQFESLSMPHLNFSFDAEQILKLLILSSRATHYIETADYRHIKGHYLDVMSINVRRSPKIAFINFPWKRPSSNVHHFYFALLFEFLWDCFHAQLKLPRLDSVFRIKQDVDRIEQLEYLQHLMEDYGLCVNTRSNLKKLKSLENAFDFDLCGESKFVWVIFEAQRLNLLFKLKRVVGDAFFNEFMTKYVLEAAELFSNDTVLPLTVFSNQHHYVMRVVLDLIWYHFRRYEQENGDKYQLRHCMQLTKVLTLSIFKYDPIKAYVVELYGYSPLSDLILCLLNDYSSFGGVRNETRLQFDLFFDEKPSLSYPS